MQTFEQIWESSRTNSWSWGYPTVVIIGVLLLIALSCIRSATWRRSLKVLTAIVLMILATEFAGREIFEKWRLRQDWAAGHREQLAPPQQDALISDGANLAIGPLAAGVQAAFIFLCTGVGLSLLRLIALRISSSEAEVSERHFS
jgi:hypothetical protein